MIARFALAYLPTQVKYARPGRFVRGGQVRGLALVSQAVVWGYAPDIDRSGMLSANPYALVEPGSRIHPYPDTAMRVREPGHRDVAMDRVSGADEEHRVVHFPEWDVHPARRERQRLEVAIRRDPSAALVNQAIATCGDMQDEAWLAVLVEDQHLKLQVDFNPVSAPLRHQYPRFLRMHERVLEGPVDRLRGQSGRHRETLYRAECPGSLLHVRSELAVDGARVVV